MTAVVLDLTVRDLADADLAACGFAGSELHLTQVAKQLDRARSGEVDYLAVCTKTDLPVAIGGVNICRIPVQVRCGSCPCTQRCSPAGSGQCSLELLRCGSWPEVLIGPRLVSS